MATKEGEASLNTSNIMQNLGDLHAQDVIMGIDNAIKGK